MKYVVLVSHGTFAPGLHSVLKMLAGGEREDVISVGLEDGMSADEFAEKFSNAISKITEDDEIILLGDIVGGSPLTNAIEQVSNKGLIGQTVIFGGMNLAMALTATLMKDGVDTDMLKDSLINEAKDAVKEFVMTSANDDEKNMSVSFLRIDDRMIHGQTVTRWSLEYPCDGLIAVNDKAATTDALKMAYKSASTKKTFVWTYEAWKKKNQKVLDSKDNYFLITKDPIQMKKILVDDGFVPSDVKKVIVGPCNDRPGAVKLGNNQSITQEEAEALEAISKAGYEIEFALIKEASIGTWDKFRGQFGFN